jgi:pimeloyl-ACP methyl ester carboxylesterase
MRTRRTLQTLATALALVLPAFWIAGEARAQSATPAVTRSNFENWSTGRVHVGEVAMFYRYAGEGPPLVLLHGWPQHSLMWHTIGPILAERFTVIAPDQRGAGMSTITPGGYDKTTMAKDLAGLLDHLGIREIYLAGYDLGAGTAAAFAREYPGRVKRVAFLEFGLAGFGYEQFMMPSRNGPSTRTGTSPSSPYRMRRSGCCAAVSASCWGGSFTISRFQATLR